jgi:hypothetical protein
METLWELRFLRSKLVLYGILLLVVSMADLTVGRQKIAEYEALVARTPKVTRHDPAGLFPKTTEVEQRRVVARAKLGYYNILFLAGELLFLVGFSLLLAGTVQVRIRTLRLASATARPN